MATDKSDLRSNSVAAQRLVARKTKWALGEAPPRPGRASTHPKPAQAAGHRRDKALHKGGHALAADVRASRLENELHLECLPLPDDERVAAAVGSEGSSDDSGSDAGTGATGQGVSDAEAFALDEADGTTATGHTLFSSALDRAVRAFQDRETVAIVKSEWSVLDDDGEEVGLSPVRKGQAAARRAGKLQGRPAAGVTGNPDRALSFEDDYEII